MATVNALSVALFNAAAGGYSAQIEKDFNSLANAVGPILEKDISTDAQFVDHLMSNLGLLNSMAVYAEARQVLQDLVYALGRGVTATVAIDFLKKQEGAANELGTVAMNFAYKVSAATEFSTINPNERDVTKLVASVTGVDTDQLAISNALAAVNPAFAASMAVALAAAEAKSAADKASALAAAKVASDAAAKNAADKAAADLKAATDKATADAAADKVAAEKALASANAALKAANDKAAEDAIKAATDKAAALATVDKTSDNSAAITAYLKAAAAVSGLTGYDSMTDSQLLSAIKTSDNQTVAISVDKTLDNPAAITTFLKASATDLGVSGTSTMTDAQLLNAIKTANDAFVAAQQKITDDALAATVKVTTDAAATKAAADLAAAVASTAAAVAAQKAADEKLAASVKVTTDAAAATAAANLKTVTDQLTAAQNLAGTTVSLNTSNNTVMGVSGGNDTVTATNATYGSDDVIVDTSTTDRDVITFTTTDDITAVPVVVGFENINVDVTSVFAGATGVTTLSFNADNIRSGSLNFAASNEASVVTDLAVTKAADLLTVTSSLRYTSVNINGDASASLTYSGLPTTLVMESTDGSLNNVTATVTKSTAGTLSTDATGTVTLTTSADTNVTASTANTVNITSGGQATVSANTADTVIVTAVEEALVTANAAENVTIFTGDGIDTASTSAIDSTLTSTNTNNITVNVQGRSVATVLDINAAPNVSQLNVSGSQNVYIKLGLNDIEGLGTSTSTTADDNLLTVVNTSTGTVNILVTTTGGDADFSSANVSNIELVKDMGASDDLTLATNSSIVVAYDQGNDLELKAKNPSDNTNTVRVSIKDDLISGVTGELTGGLTLTSFATATLTNNDASTAAPLGAVSASGTTLTIASGVQGFEANSSINVGAGTLRVTGVAPVILGSAVTANDVAASDATGAITLGLVGVATVGTVVTGSGDDVITISTAARTSGDYTISTGAGSDSLVLSFAEGFSWNGGLGYDTLKLDTTLDLSAQAVTLTNVDAISLDTEDDGTESLTITSAQFNTNTTFTLLGGGINDDTLIVKGAETADTINASAVSVEVSEAYLTLNGNGGADTITGSAFADIINGGAGADTMSGGDFADTYIFNTDNVESGESIFEASNGLGIDTVSVVTTTVFTTMTSASFDEIEALTFASGASGTFTGAQLTGEAITLTGDSVGTETLTVNVGLGETFVSGLTSGTNFNTVYYTGTTGDEVITGSALAETITGGTGSDLLTGGDGIDTYVFPTASGGTNGIDSIVFSNVSGSAVADIMDFTANDPFIGTVTVSSLVISSVVTTNVSGAAGKNILFLTGSYFASASALAAVTTLFTNCDTGNVLIVYAENATANSRIAFCALNDAGNVTAATDVAILVGLTIDKASTGLGDGNFILN